MMMSLLLAKPMHNRLKKRGVVLKKRRAQKRHCSQQ